MRLQLRSKAAWASCMRASERTCSWGRWEAISGSVGTAAPAWRASPWRCSWATPAGAKREHLVGAAFGVEQAGRHPFAIGLRGQQEGPAAVEQGALRLRAMTLRAAGGASRRSRLASPGEMRDGNHQALGELDPVKMFFAAVPW